MLITGFIAWGSWGLLRDSLKMGLLGVPDGIDHGAVSAFLGKQPGVTAVHDLHIWPMSTTETAMTAHVTRPDNPDGDAFLHAACEGLEKRFKIGHCTLQVETGGAEVCRLSPAEAV